MELTSSYLVSRDRCWIKLFSVHDSAGTIIYINSAISGGWRKSSCKLNLSSMLYLMLYIFLKRYNSFFPFNRG
nr:MAG TPA: hypothetical protein [Caudoviricetes sp.]